MTAGPGGGLYSALDGLAAAAGSGAGLLVALDFDGVLAPLVDDPSASRALPASVRALGRLAAAPGVHLALVSGRALADLAALADVPDGTLLVGSHGAERGAVRDGRLTSEELALTADRAAVHRELADRVTALAGGGPARVEVKPTTVVLHTRGVDPSAAATLGRQVADLGAAAGVDVLRGKDVVELCVLTVTKGDAVDHLRASTGAARVLYAGDDVTDERALQRLRDGDVGVHVGDGESVAPYRVADPEAVADLLSALAERLGR